ncbi:MAG: protease inhibitor I42 family protein [Actinomycetota bacterium]
MGLVVGVSLLLASCAEPEEGVTASAAPEAQPTEAASAPGSKTVALDEGDSGKALSLAEGDEVTLTLETNPGTGYQWEYADEPDAAVLKQVSDETVKPETSPGMVGVPEERMWTYEAVGPGKTKVTLEYMPPGGGEAEETFSFSVEVAE